MHSAKLSILWYVDAARCTREREIDYNHLGVSQNGCAAEDKKRQQTNRSQQSVDRDCLPHCQQTRLSMNEYRYIQAEKKDHSMVICFAEQNLEGETLAECIRLEIDQLLQGESPDKLIVDFTNVRRISSLVISTLLLVRQKLSTRRIPVVLCSLPVPILEIYRTLQLAGTQFQVFDSVNDALAAPTVLDSVYPDEQMED